MTETQRPCRLQVDAFRGVPAGLGWSAIISLSLCLVWGPVLARFCLQVSLPHCVPDRSLWLQPPRISPCFLRRGPGSPGPSCGFSVSGSRRPAGLWGVSAPRAPVRGPPASPPPCPGAAGLARAAPGRAGPVARRPMFCRSKLGLWATAGGRPGNPRRAWERAGEGRGERPGGRGGPQEGRGGGGTRWGAGGMRLGYPGSFGKTKGDWGLGLGTRSFRGQLEGGLGKTEIVGGAWRGGEGRRLGERGRKVEEEFEGAGRGALGRVPEGKHGKLEVSRSTSGRSEGREPRGGGVQRTDSWRAGQRAEL